MSATSARRDRTGGFTLVELLVAMILIGATVVPTVHGVIVSQQRTQTFAIVDNLQQQYQAQVDPRALDEATVDGETRTVAWPVTVDVRIGPGRLPGTCTLTSRDPFAPADCRAVSTADRPRP